MSRLDLQKEMREKYGVFPGAMHITRIENLTAIFESGKLQCRRLLGKEEFLDISEPSAQDKRRNKKVLGTDLTLFDYVPFFLTYKAPMVSAKRTENKDLVYLRINLDVFSRLKGCVTSSVSLISL